MKTAARRAERRVEALWSAVVIGAVRVGTQPWLAELREAVGKLASSEFRTPAPTRADREAVVASILGAAANDSARAIAVSA